MTQIKLSEQLKFRGIYAQLQNCSMNFLKFLGPPEESWDGGLGLRAWGSGGPYVPRLVPALPAQSAGS